MMVMSFRLARPARASPPEEPTPMTAVWLAPKLNERISMAPALLVLGPGRPSTIRYALTAIAISLRGQFETTCWLERQLAAAQRSRQKELTPDTARVEKEPARIRAQRAT